MDVMLTDSLNLYLTNVQVSRDQISAADLWLIAGDAEVDGLIVVFLSVSPLILMVSDDLGMWGREKVKIQLKKNVKNFKIITEKRIKKPKNIFFIEKLIKK